MYNKFNSKILNYDFDFNQLPKWSAYSILLKKHYKQDLDAILQQIDPKQRNSAQLFRSMMDVFFSSKKYTKVINSKADDEGWIKLFALCNL